MGRDRVRRAKLDEHQDRLHENGMYGINTFLTLSHNYAMKENKVKCWVCAHLPHSSRTGLPLAVIPFEELDYCRVRWYHNYALQRTSNELCMSFARGWYPPYSLVKKPRILGLRTNKLGSFAYSGRSRAANFMQEILFYL